MTGATPIAIPASVGSMPVLILLQNSRSLARGCEGAPGDVIGALPVTSRIQFDGRPTTPSDQVLLPPVEPSNYMAMVYTDRIVELGAVPSTGSVGDSFDNAMAEAVNNLYKTELIRQRGPWRTVEQVELATLEWVWWWNNQRLHGELDMRTPLEVENAYYADLESAQPAVAGQGSR